MYFIKIKHEEKIIAQTGSPDLNQIKEWLKADIHRHPDEAVIEITHEPYEYELSECLAARKNEYPSAEDFLDAWFDGGPEKLNDLEMKRLAIKAKYPKPAVKASSIIESVTVFDKKEQFKNEMLEEQALPDFLD